MKNQIEEAAKIVRDGGVILYPTDTIWGLGCDPNNEEAIQKINEIKQRPPDKSFILLVNSEMLLNRYTEVIPDVCYDLIDYADRPLTIIYPKGRAVSSKIMADDNSIAIRMIKAGFSNQLMTRLKHGLVSTSANISNHPYPKQFGDIDDTIKNMVDFVVDPQFENESSKPSQIIKISENGEVKIIRK